MYFKEKNHILQLPPFLLHIRSCQSLELETITMSVLTTPKNMASIRLESPSQKIRMVMRYQSHQLICKHETIVWREQWE